MLFQLCSMSGQVNNQSKSSSPNNSDWDSGPDVAGIYYNSDPSHVVHHSMRRIAAHLRRINEALESLDSKLAKYRACIKNKLLGMLCRNVPTSGSIEPDVGTFLLKTFSKHLKR